jgi:DNA-directed RNA polymerase subunit RPC12/RpoP
MHYLVPSLIPGLVMPGIRWARLQVDANIRLRRGAWYKVLKEEGFDLIIEVNRRPVRALRALFEVRDRPIPRWTIVAAKAGKKSPMSGHYAVCPSCNERTNVKGKPKRLACTRCRSEFEVAWDEVYLR